MDFGVGPKVSRRCREVADPDAETLAPFGCEFSQGTQFRLELSSSAEPKTFTKPLV